MYFDDFDTQITPEELDMDGIYDFVNNQDDNEYFQAANSTFKKYTNR